MLTIDSLTVGLMGKTAIKLNRAMQKAGILEIMAQSGTGAYLCMVDLNKIDLSCKKANVRKRSRAHINEIARNWHDDCAREPILRFHNGRLTTIDGRHTITVMRDIEKKEHWTCLVHFNITDEEAARKFYYLTVNSKRIDPWDAFICAVASGMKHALDIRNMLEEHDILHPRCEGRTDKNSDIRSYTVLHEAWSLRGDNEILGRFVYVLGRCFRNGMGRIDDAARNVEFVRGLLDFIQSGEWAEMWPDEISEFLEVHQASEISDRAKAMAYDEGTDRPTRGHYKRAFEKFANMPLRSSNGFSASGNRSHRSLKAMRN